MKFYQYVSSPLYFDIQLLNKGFGNILSIISLHGEIIAPRFVLRTFGN